MCVCDAVLIAHSISVVQASGECLRAVLATKAGTYVFTKLEESNSESCEWYVYLEPFKPHKRRKVLCKYSTHSGTHLPLCSLLLRHHLVLHPMSLLPTLMPVICGSHLEACLITSGSPGLLQPSLTVGL